VLRSRLLFPAAFLVPALAACSWQGARLAGQPGLEREVEDFYEGRAMEDYARCPNPRMVAIIRDDIVADTPERVVMDLRYRWVDDTQTTDSGGNHTKIVCQDWAERRFTFARGADGRLSVVAMSGPQQR
jgi:hypothetical protein